jgi:hypothetical protein
MPRRRCYTPTCSPAANAGISVIRGATQGAGQWLHAREEGQNMRYRAMMFAGLMTGIAALATIAGCSPAPASTDQAQACPPGSPWIPGNYANAKYVPGHCQGQPAQ